MHEGLALAASVEVGRGFSTPEAAASFIENDILAKGHGADAAARVLGVLPWYQRKPATQILARNLKTKNPGDLLDLLKAVDRLAQES